MTWYTVMIFWHSVRIIPVCVLSLAQWLLALKSLGPHAFFTPMLLLPLHHLGSSFTPRRQHLLTRRNSTV
jgi:hypothetical protein